MLAPTSTHILTLSNTQAKELAGRFVSIGGATYHFKSYDPDHPGQPPWCSGAEGKAYPLLGKDGTIAAYAKFFSQATQKRFERTAWLIGQQLYTWLPNLAAAPLLWTDTRRGLQSEKIGFAFSAYLAKAVRGETWLEHKTRMVRRETYFPEGLRWRCLSDLLVVLAVLERAGLVHGDLSPNNVVIDYNARGSEPALYLIDFDAFFAPAAGVNRSVTVAEGGTYGTQGYCPADLAAAAKLGDDSVAPYSDRYGRDMLLLEFLLMRRGLPADDPLADWSREQLQRLFAAWRARSDPECVRVLRHLNPATVFDLNESQRPSSVDLAIGLGLSLPERRLLRRVTELPRPTPATLGGRTTLAEKDPAGQSQTVEAQYRARQGSRMRRIRPFYRKVRPQWKVGDDDLDTFIAIMLAVVLPFLLTVMFEAMSSGSKEPENASHYTNPVNPYK
jgi:serine/threonine protein kinase